jgi:hypothetical protein
MKGALWGQNVTQEVRRSVVKQTEALARTRDQLPRSGHRPM